jgi:hypothetical protein
VPTSNRLVQEEWTALMRTFQQLMHQLPLEKLGELLKFVGGTPQLQAFTVMADESAPVDNLPTSSTCKRWAARPLPAC